MKVEIIAKPEQAKETPFVVGGVYRMDYGDTYLLVKDISPDDRETPYRFVVLAESGSESNEANGCLALSAEDVKRSLSNMTYYPQARLVIDMTK
jgi:hypothetical protein